MIWIETKAAIGCENGCYERLLSGRVWNAFVIGWGTSGHMMRAVRSPTEHRNGTRGGYFVITLCTPGQVLVRLIQ